MTLKQKYELAMDLLERATNMMEDAMPDAAWGEQYFGLTGEHMLLTEEGWEPGDVKYTYDEYPDAILLELNAPKTKRRRVLTSKKGKIQAASLGGPIRPKKDRKAK